MGAVLDRLRLGRSGGAAVRGTLWVTFALSFIACSLDQSPGSGGLAVLVDSDMAVPKDIDQITVDVTQSGKSIKHDEQQFTEGRVGLPWEVRVPRTDDHSPATIRVVAFKEGRTRVVREAITPIPTAYLGVLRMSVGYLCDGMVDNAGESTCGLDQTCMQGTCAPATLTMDPSPYGALDMTLIAAVRAADAGVDNCFNISSCFSEATEVSPDANCAFIPPSLFGDHLNVALRLDLGSPGMCDDTACWIVLDSGTDGWRIINGQVVLPTNICERRNQGSNLRVAVTQLCSPKTEVMPSCPSGTPAATVPGQNTPITSVATAQGVLPAVGDACSGAGTKACDMCGKSDRMCQNGLWSSYAECTNQGECAQNLSQACGNSGMRTCGGDCTWGRCESQRCEGAATRACGNCGTQHRACDNGVWAEWSACEAEGECTPNVTEACGVAGTRACGGNCTWGPCGMQQCPGAPSQACGNCGMQMRTCDGGTATWSAWGSCDGEGVCAPNTTQTCGMNGTQTCGGKCQWDVACTGQTCPGAAAEACGNCGTRTRICDMNTGEWSAWSECLGQGVCAPDTTRACGATGTGTQSCAGNCQWDAACTGQKCGGASVEACGLCGTHSRTCNTNNGTWSDWTACSNEGDCSPGATRTCGAGGMQTCTALCKWPAACPGQMCDGSATLPCGSCGTQTRTCNTNTGTWSQPSACQNPGVCKPGGTPRACGTSAHQPCASTCQWGACACDVGLTMCGMDNAGGLICKDLSSDSGNCGKCGVTCGNGQTCVGGQCQCGPNQLLCNGSCVSSSNNADCGRCGNACTGNSTCRQTANGAACSCPDGQVLCNGLCTTVVGSDPTNCGGCGRQCGNGQSCVMGECMLVCGGTTPNKCGSTSCTNVKTDKANCGSCGNVCGAGQTCTDGVCCATGSKVCTGTCTNISSDPSNCGDCNNVCLAPAMCSSGACMLVCGGSTPDMCSASACTNVQTDENNCGKCGNRCAVGQICTDGKCCGGGQVLCAGECTSTNSDSGNCGACGKACSPGQTCVAGKCALVCSVETPDECSNKCTNTQSDHDNCGSCGMLCGTNEMCLGGKCTLVCGGNTPDMCNGACTTMQTDRNNCGRCGAVCPSGQMCVGGQCGCTPDAPLYCNGQCVPSNDANCGTCGVSCTGGSSGTACRAGQCVCPMPGEMQCGATCADVTTDAKNCGACGNSCGANQKCSDSKCTCTTGTACGTDTKTCFDLQSDRSHCGSCENACGAGQTCMSGVCCGGADQMICGGACIDTSSNPTHCGSCSNSCNQGDSCVGGKCMLVCTGETTACGNACVDTKTNSSNCGGCNMKCPGEQTCNGGTCACPGVTMLCADGSCQAQCPCPAGEHRCGNACVKISNSSCTAACIACPTVSNGTSTCNGSDQCETKCDAVQCPGFCCKSGQTCGATGCTDPMSPPQGGSGSTQQSGGTGARGAMGGGGRGDSSEPDSGVKMFDGGPIIENSPPPSPPPR